MKGWQIRIGGVVQGVGFRPTVWRVARELGACGDVSNNASGVLINLLLPPTCSVDDFIRCLTSQAPRISRIDNVHVTEVEIPTCDGFSIVASDKHGSMSITDVSPDVAICSECLEDINAGSNRHRYWLTNCTLCGPRFTITRRLPYDRPNTTMQNFPLCKDCRREYANPADRRFHAQPVACNNCGPVYSHSPEEVAKRIKNGEIVMLKGVGGYNLLCDATDAVAVLALRNMKNRPRKPFAVMVADAEMARGIVHLEDAEINALQSWRNPIVIAQARHTLPPEVAPGLGTLGVMLPGMGFQHALMHEVARPVILTSANYPGASIISDDTEAATYAAGHHLHITGYAREIANRIDDSVVRVINSQPRLLRRARGYTPDPLLNIHPRVDGIIGMGADVTSQWGFGRGSDIILSQYIGHLHTEGGEQFLHESIRNLSELYQLTPRIIVTDKHPDYVSTSVGEAWAKQSGAEVVHVWHHHAHALAVMAEYKLRDTIAALVLDGTGLGPDGNIWGCELLEARTDGFERIWHGPQMPMPGGDIAARQPWRMAVSLADTFGIPLPTTLTDTVGTEKCELVKTMCRKGINSPITCGAGRLWDAVSAWLGISYTNGYEAESPILLEWAATQWKGSLPDNDSLPDILADNKADVNFRAARFHAWFARECADAVNSAGIKRVILTGGVFQNALFTRLLTRRLDASGITFLLPRMLPPGDGQIATGQIYYAALNA